ncbi:hypothetical protein BT96DRAFT_938122 [Gymnopus androsaceus JB14]|uniref:C2 NT-type domain-containing protein n=1 Tax=Gymnopus androsaceus JB14 TaxID=1447944 RepID=A0A6A4HW39_9AGAR|nr:hypothetical protein BT96DRAFT_938122 [Gymnopus androsaceus JB14]
MSLSKQMTFLSAAAHLILALYNGNKGGFIPIQLCFDVMSMVKNAYFCHQLTTRIDGAVQCVNILSEHPEWGGESRRLNVKVISKAKDNEVTSKYDHINPITWRGDVKVQNVLLLACWEEGRVIAEKELCEGVMEPPFECMEQEGGYDILCPLGKEKVILVSDLAVGEEEEGEDETHTYNGLKSESTVPEPAHKRFLKDAPSMNHVHQSDLAPDPEDVAADLESTQESEASGTRKHEAWRIRGYRKYAPPSLPDGIDLSELEKSEVILIEDPALTIIECEGQAFLALIKVRTILYNNRSHLGGLSYYQSKFYRKFVK